MKLTIHRGAEQIGGSIIEVTSKDIRLILDVGLPLPNPDDDGHGALEQKPEVPGLWREDGSGPPVTAIFISHIHADHCGLLHKVLPDLPVYLSPGSHSLLEALSLFDPERPPGLSRCKILDRDKPIQLGELSIQAFPVDHSAFDSRAFMVSDGVRRIVYSGDLRAHGRTAGRFEALKTKVRPCPDALLLEGTRVGREESGSVLRTEEEVEKRFKQLIQDWPGPVLISFSPLNIDRLVSAFKAVRATGRDLLVDPYSALIMNSLDSWPNIPKTSWAGIKVWFPKRVTDWIRKLGLGQRVEALRRHGVKWVDLSDDQDKYVFLFRPSMTRNLPDCGTGKARLVYSMWTGYLDRPEWSQTLQDPRIGSFEKVHVSGHASLEDLIRLCQAIKPKRIIPIHTEFPEGFLGLFPETTVLPDGDLLELL